MLSKSNEGSMKRILVQPSYLDQIVTKKGLLMQSVHIAKTRHSPVRLKAVTFTRKFECKMEFHDQGAVHASPKAAQTTRHQACHELD